MRIKIKYHTVFYTISHERVKLRILAINVFYLIDLYYFNFCYFTY
ncbi:hypothetical protein A4U88_0010 [Serratia marcescens]|nr:hypothetical protein A4U88_0010 [Serratia marcescens]